MKYIYEGNQYDAIVEQDGKVGPLIITVVVKEPTTESVINEIGEKQEVFIPGLRLHVSDPTVTDGVAQGGEIVARVELGAE